MLYRFVFFILLLIISIRPVYFIVNQRDSLFSKGYISQYQQYRNLYYNSQYVKKNNPGIIPDNALESFAGGFFLKGNNPILILHDQPPLGRYIIALSIFLFDNPSTIIVFLMILSALALYLLSLETYSNALFALIPVGIFINEPLFLNKFQYLPLLEPIQLPFFLFAIYFFIKGVTEKKYSAYFILTSLMLGFVISTRFFILGLGLLVSMCGYLLLRYKIDRKLIVFFLTLPLSLLVLEGSYIKTMQSGYSPIHILGIQKYILNYHTSKFILPFSFWDLLLFNRWHTWWGTWAISSDYQWIILWPFSVILSILLLIGDILKKIILTNEEQMIFLVLCMQCIILSAGFTSTRYFLPVIPLFYILAVSCILKCIKYLHAYEKNIR